MIFVNFASSGHWYDGKSQLNFEQILGPEQKVQVDTSKYEVKPVVSMKHDCENWDEYVVNCFLATSEH